MKPYITLLLALFIIGCSLGSSGLVRPSSPNAIMAYGHISLPQKSVEKFVLTGTDGKTTDVFIVDKGTLPPGGNFVSANITPGKYAITRIQFTSRSYNGGKTHRITFNSRTKYIPVPEGKRMVFLGDISIHIAKSKSELARNLNITMAQLDTCILRSGPIRLRKHSRYVLRNDVPINNLTYARDAIEDEGVSHYYIVDRNRRYTERESIRAELRSINAIIKHSMRLFEWEDLLKRRKRQLQKKLTMLESR